MIKITLSFPTKLTSHALVEISKLESFFNVGYIFSIMKL